MRDAFFASPKFPRLLSPDAVKHTISRGVEAGMMAYVVKEPSGKYEPFVFRQRLGEGELEVAEDVFLITKDAAEAYLRAENLARSQLPFLTLQRRSQAGATAPALPRKSPRRLRRL